MGNYFEGIDTESTPTTDNYFAGVDTPVEEKPQEKGFFQRVGEDLSKRGSNIASEFMPSTDDESIFETFKRAPERVLRTAGQIAGGINDIFGEGLKSTYETVVPESMRKQAEEMPIVSNTEIGRAGLRGMKSIIEGYRGFKEAYPDTAKDIEAVANIATAIPIGWGSKYAAEAVGEPTAKAIGSIVAGQTGEQLDKEITKTVTDNIAKAIKTTERGKTTYPLVEKYFANSDMAVRDIVENKNNITLTNEVGDLVKGELPKTRKQFSEAVHQEKAKLFNEFDAMKQAAGEKGVKIDLEPLAKELDSVINDVSLRGDKDGIKIISHAIEQQELLRQVAKFTPDEAQKWIARANNKLENYYTKGGTFVEGSTAAVDAGVASMMRKILDKAITSTEGIGYQELKLKYGALSELEAGVNKAAFQSSKDIAMPNFFDITSGAALLHGILAMNPATIGGAGVMEIMNFVRRNLKKPDRYVEKMFKEVNELMDKKKAYDAREGLLTPTNMESYVTGGRLKMAETLPRNITPRSSIEGEGFSMSPERKMITFEPTKEWIEDILKGNKKLFETKALPLERRPVFGREPLTEMPEGFYGEVAGTPPSLMRAEFKEGAPRDYRTYEHHQGEPEEVKEVFRKAEQSLRDVKRKSKEVNKKKKKNKMY